ncbi:hypothetical protein BJ322DRAFT_703180 [Thelephora terrestris]|uniref:NUC153 domain-containing protein n=1 Tax=Thelephora terrestris TaxID=56493 RepID=A0A9P6HJ99_9AGAM|nr:hypothetical protein BJ322DRAFT_703180 [Thelephora terrestris]
MSDPRFAKFKTDPRFRRIKKNDHKVVVDERFKSIFQDDRKSKKRKPKGSGRVDKYGRQLADDRDQDDLRRFYKLENNDLGDNDQEETSPAPIPDLARGAVLLESSDEEEEAADSEDDDTLVRLGHSEFKPIDIPDKELEIDLDETNFAELDAQADALIKADKERGAGPEIEPTRRLAVVNLDWDNVKAVHLFKMFSSLVASGPPSACDKKASKPVARGQVLNVRIYPSDFGRERMAKEEREGPPAELFKKPKEFEHEDEVNEQNIFETGDVEEEVDEEALRKYQLERLRYYYAIVECDGPNTASHIFNELDGTELERSANVFDMSFVPDEMKFDQEPRDEATGDSLTTFKHLEFSTDALRHSKVKLTWDQDDPERNKVTRRALTKKEIDEEDFRAYIACSSDESDQEGTGKGASRDRLRSLLSGGTKDELPEGWGNSNDHADNEDDIDMQITFTPGLTDKKGEDETTLEKYQRKLREKRKKKKEEARDATKEKEVQQKKKPKQPLDDFFDADSGSEEGAVETRKRKKEKKGKETSEPRTAATAEELALLVASDNPNGAKHFDMSAVLKAEKKSGKKGKKEKPGPNDQDTQEDFHIDVADERFKAVHEDHAFAIDPSNPRFKKTKSMSALLEERRKRQQGKEEVSDSMSKAEGQKSLSSLVESVKRKSRAIEEKHVRKRRKLALK